MLDDYAEVIRRHEVFVAEGHQIEGILVLTDERLRAQFDHAVFVDTPADVRLARRLRRDTSERGRSVDGVLNQYFQTVRPMYDEFVAPTRSQADTVIHGESTPSECLEALLGALEPLLGNTSYSSSDSSSWSHSAAS